MTPEQHYKRAEERLKVSYVLYGDGDEEHAAHELACAQVHATLATVHRPDRVFIGAYEPGAEVEG